MYHKVWKLFNSFYLQLDIKQDNWEDRLTLLVGYLVDQNRKAATVKSYISAIKSVLKEDAYELSENTYLLTSLIKACRYRNNRVSLRLPIQKDMVNAILTKIDQTYSTNTNNQPYLAMLYKTMISTSYYGLLRIGEVAKGNHPVLARGVHVGQNKKKFLLLLRMSKTHCEDDKPQTMKIKSTQKDQKPCNFKRTGEKIIGGSKGGRQGRVPPLGVQILSFSCSFRQKCEK